MDEDRKRQLQQLLRENPDLLYPVVKEMADALGEGDDFIREVLKVAGVTDEKIKEVMP